MQRLSLTQRVLLLLRRWFADEAGLPGLVWIMIATGGLAAAVRFMVMPFTTIYLSRVTQLSPATIGAIVGLGAVGSIAFGIVGGYWTDRVGRKAGIMLGAGLDAAAMAGMAVARHPWEFAACSFLLGIAWSVLGPASHALLTDLTPPRLRTRVFGYEYWAVNVGAAVGPLVGVSLGAGRSGAMFLAVAAASLGVLLVAWKWVPARVLAGRDARASAGAAGAEEDAPAAGAGSGEATGTVPSLREALRVLAGDRLLQVFVAGSVFVSLCYSQIETNLARYLSLAMAGGDALFARLLSTNAITVLLLQPLLGRLAERRGPFTGVVLGPSLYALAALGFFVAGSNVTAWIVAMVVFTVGEVLLAPAQQGIVAALAPERLRGTYFATLNWGGAVAHAVGPAAGGFLLAGGDARALFAGMAAAAGMAALLFAGVARRASGLASSGHGTAARMDQLGA